MDGYHTAVLAYGQTSTGKTHTMTGTAAQPGLIPLVIQECFQYLNRRQQQQQQQQPNNREGAEESREYLFRVSYLEVYKEHIRDLLATSTTAPGVRLFDSKEDGLVIKGLKEVVVTSPKQVFALLQQGEARRQVGATHLNQHSSRSHVMVRLWIESRCCSSSGGGAGSSNNKTLSTSSSTGSLASSSVERSSVRVSSLSLVDLAGSESVRLTGSSERRQEGHYINKSLMTLGQVVYALSEATDEKTPSTTAPKKHIPYRDSKLTRLLQPCLSGNAQVVLLCCISPLASHIEESHNTFKFAVRAKKIPQRATIQETADEKTLLQSYREEIEDLKQQLKEMREVQEKYLRASEHSTVSTASAVSGDSVSETDVNELVEAIQTMEKLILKSTASGPAVPPEDLMDLSEGFDLEEEKNLLALVNSSESNSIATPAAAKTAATTMTAEGEGDKALHSELSRIKGLLGSVLQKRMTTPGGDADKVVRNLRAQLEEQQVATSLRQADSSFLQAQLEEKDNLLQEVSKILEAVEERQAKLELENAALRKEVTALKERP